MIGKQIQKPVKDWCEYTESDDFSPILPTMKWPHEAEGK